MIFALACTAGIALVYQIRLAISEARRLHDTRPCPGCEALRERLDRSKAERDQYRAWARAITATEHPGWELAAGTMSRWSSAVDTDPGTPL